MFSFIVHFEWGQIWRLKRFRIQNVKELQSHKISLEQVLLDAITTPKSMQIRWTVMEKQNQNLRTYTSGVNDCDDLYRTCTVHLSALITPHWKVLRS